MGGAVNAVAAIQFVTKLQRNMKYQIMTKPIITDRNCIKWPVKCGCDAHRVCFRHPKCIGLETAPPIKRSAPIDSILRFFFSDKKLSSFMFNHNNFVASLDKTTFSSSIIEFSFNHYFPGWAQQSVSNSGMTDHGMIFCIS